MDIIFVTHSIKVTSHFIVSKIRPVFQSDYNSISRKFFLNIYVCTSFQFQQYEFIKFNRLMLQGVHYDYVFCT